MGIELQPMTRARMHEFYYGFSYDPDVFMDRALYEKYNTCTYDAKKVDALFDLLSKETVGVDFAVMLDGRVIGEIRLKHFDADKKNVS